MQPTAWLFTKDPSAVRMELRPSDRGVTLTIEGPETAGHVYEFGGAAEAEAFRTEYERRLIAEGFKLQAISERRQDGRGVPSGGNRRRR
jgi:hypothetical protein